eukprot:CAMPEP_0198147090 /NCGR_PEP_ID=MMETSP1443-20131203/33195_1 /TAXON_ID=186043 /ORGANISM="Entomoneis sp., Strain CCMP2396" /LENGTH=146 /DNA_ID=CAMNT_0043811245 /DNA_START=264 /DNA_END=701 /DNA_ORIENTATION=+
MSAAIKDWHPAPGGDEACLRLNRGGTLYEEFTCRFPALSFTYSTPELTYDPIPMRDWMEEHPFVPIIACVMYAAMIVLGRMYFADKPRWNWRWTLAMWNLFLSVFSLIGFLRTAPAIFFVYTNYSWQENLCFDPEAHVGSGSVGVW